MPSPNEPLRPGPELFDPELRTRWAELAANPNRATPFQTPAWLTEQYTRHTEGEPLPTMMKHGFAPLIRQSKGLVTVLRLAGADYEDFLCPTGEEAAAFSDLCTVLLKNRRWQVAHFRAQRDEGALLTGWRAVESGGGEPKKALSRFFAREAPHRIHHVVALPGTWQAYEARLSKKFAYKLRAAAGRRERGFTSSELRRASAETLETDLDALIAVHTRRWQARGETGIFKSARHIEEFKASARALLAAGQLRLYTLWLEGAVASALYCVADRRAYYYYIGGIDTAHQRHHPGKVLIARAIQDAIADGCGEFDFLSGGEEYKADWETVERQVKRLILGRGPVGWLVVRVFGPVDAQLRARKAAREAKKALAWSSGAATAGTDASDATEAE